jgi:hypothetical protein
VVDGLELSAERFAGRRHRLSTVVVRDLSATPEGRAEGADAGAADVEGNGAGEPARADARTDRPEARTDGRPAGRGDGGSTGRTGPHGATAAGQGAGSRGTS